MEKIFELHDNLNHTLWDTFDLSKSVEFNLRLKIEWQIDDALEFGESFDDAIMEELLYPDEL